MPTFASKITRTLNEIKASTNKQIATAITAGFGFLIALAWRDAIQQLLDKLIQKLGVTGTAYIYMIITTLFITIIGGLGIFLVSKWGAKSEAEVRKK